MRLVDCIIQTCSISGEGPCALTAVTLKGVEVLEVLQTLEGSYETEESAGYTRLFHSALLDKVLAIIDQFGASILIL